MKPPNWPERPHGGFRCCLVDPPWAFSNWSAKGEVKNPKAHYACMELADIKALPVAELMAQDSALFMWATWPMLPQALELLAAWGMTYKTGGAWGKQSRTGNAINFGTGYVFRSASEPLIVGTRGKPTWLSRSVRNLWLAPVREHSRKPSQVLDDIERLTPGPRLELFARETREGWTPFGLEVGKFDVAGQ
jgi:N6-adenosine-specific RNA methylase IME4